MEPKDISVLIVDDIYIVHSQMKHLFNRKGYNNLNFAYDGQSAIDMYKDLKSHVVIMDYMMPGKDGVKTTKDILELSKKYNINTIVIPFTGYPDIKSDFEKAGATGFLTKPLRNHKIEYMFKLIEENLVVEKYKKKTSE